MQEVISKMPEDPRSRQKRIRGFFISPVLSKYPTGNQAKWTLFSYFHINLP